MESKQCADHNISVDLTTVVSNQCYYQINRTCFRLQSIIHSHTISHILYIEQVLTVLRNNMFLLIWYFFGIS